MEESFDERERGLALVYAYIALVRALQRHGLSLDPLFEELAGARGRMESIGESGAAAALAAIAENLQGI